MLGPEDLAAHGQVRAGHLNEVCAVTEKTFQNPLTNPKASVNVGDRESDPATTNRLSAVSTVQSGSRLSQENPPATTHPQRSQTVQSGGFSYYAQCPGCRKEFTSPSAEILARSCADACARRRDHLHALNGLWNADGDTWVKLSRRLRKRLA